MFFHHLNSLVSHKNSNNTRHLNWKHSLQNKPLHHYKPLLERIQNGDFDYPEYFEQAEWEDHWAEEEIASKMGITNGHRFLKFSNAFTSSNLKNLTGKIVAVDVFIYLYELLYSSITDEE